ncbi:MAG TPA: hypothetical protein VE263_13995 [Candidatus Angelobacter sp.]|nr:hypothetical protein [Candidatus Angelobacter sp.]
MSGTLFAQSPSQSSGAEIIRIRAITGAGMCYGYCVEELTMQEGRAKLLRRANGKSRKYRELGAKHKLAKQEWEELQRSVDAEAKAAMVGRIGCPGCVDQVVVTIELQFKDGSQKSVTYSLGEEPPAITKLLKRIDAIRAQFTLKTPPPKCD